MKILGFALLALLVTLSTSLSSCSPMSRSGKAIVVDDYGSMRYVNGKPDRVHKKWKSKAAYKPKNNKVAQRKTADW
jgi:hypothetical protein